MKITQIVVFLLVILLISSQEKIPDESIFSTIHGLTLKSEKALSEILKETDMTYFAFYYTKNSQNSRKGAEILSKVAQKLNFLAGILLIDCDDYITSESNKFCVKDPEAQDGFPKMYLYVPPEYKINPYTKKVNEHSLLHYDKHEVSENNVYNFITPYIQSRSIALNNDNIDQFLSEMALNKVILFTEKTKTPLMWRGLSNFYYDRLSFAHVDKDQTAIIKKFKIVNYPTIIIYQVHEEEVPLDKPEWEKYPGMLIAFDIAEYLRKYALPEKQYLVEQKKGADSLKYKSKFKQLNQDNYIDYFKKFQNRKFVMFLSETDEIPEDLKKFNLHTAGYFQFVKFKCVDDFCKNNFNVKSYPTLLLFTNKPENEINANILKSLYLPIEYNYLISEIKSLYNENFKIANNENFQRVVKEVSSNKVPLLYFYDVGEVEIAYHLLSSDPVYTKYIEFIVFENPHLELLNHFKLKKLPELLFLISNKDNKEQVQAISYREEIIYSRLKNFLDQYFVKNKETNVEVDNNQVKDVTFYSSNNEIKNNCFNKKKLCLIGLLDGRSNLNSVESFDKSIKTLENVMNDDKSKPFTFGWVNATCQYEFSNSVNVNIESLPSLILYIPHKDLYANLVGTFDTENILFFIENALRGRTPLYSMQKSDFALKDKNCEEIKERAQESLEDDEILREIIEEERKKREQFEKEREGMKQKKKKKKDL